MGVTKVSNELCREVRDLLIEAAKYTASEDLEKAVKCYAKVLDLESQKKEVYVPLARCLYRIGLKKNDIFGGEDDEADGSGDEVSDDDDDEEMSDDEEASDTEGDRSAAPSLNSRLYQFDHLEEEELEGDAVSERISKEEVQDDLQSIPEDVEISEEQPADDALSPADGFENYLQGDVFENALELLYRARIMYMESSKPFEEIPKAVQISLVEIYQLLGDIDQELEDFTQAVSDYEEAISLYHKATSQKTSDEVVTLHMKLADAMRWMDTKSDGSMTREDYKKRLMSIKQILKEKIKSQETSSEKDELYLQTIEEDLGMLEEELNQKTDAVFDKSVIMQAIMKQALEATQQGQVNDLSKMVKKNRKKPRKETKSRPKPKP